MDKRGIRPWISCLLPMICLESFCGSLSRIESALRDFMRELRGLSRRENALRDFMRELRGLSRRERDVWLWFWMSCCNRLT